MSNTFRASAVNNDIVFQIETTRIGFKKCYTYAHLPMLFHLATMVFHLGSVLFHLLSAQFHFPHAILVEQRFFLYIFNGQLTRLSIILHSVHIDLNSTYLVLKVITSSYVAIEYSLFS